MKGEMDQMIMKVCSVEDEYQGKKNYDQSAQIQEFIVCADRSILMKTKENP